MRSLVVNNQKGGVGKTTVATTFAWYLAQDPTLRVAMIDLDKQANTTKLMKAERRAVESSQLLLASPAPLLDSAPGITLYPASAKLDAVTNTESQDGRDADDYFNTFEANLKLMEERFDYAVIDTGPTWNLGTQIPMAVATAAIAPLQPETMALDGIKTLIRIVQLMNSSSRKADPLNFLGILPSKVDKRSTMHREITEILFRDYSTFCFPGIFPEREAFKKSNHESLSIFRYAEEFKASGARQVVQEITPLMAKMRDALDAPPLKKVA